MKATGGSAPFPAYLDEALTMREWRRARRWLRTSSVPTLYALGSVLLPWLVVPALYASVGWYGRSVLQSQPGWMFLSLALALVGGAMATAFARVSQIWQTERVRQTLEGWFLSGQEPLPLVATAALSGAAAALLVSLPGGLLLVGTAVYLQVAASQLLLTLLLLVGGAALAAAAGSAVFFATTVGRSTQEKAARPGRPAWDPLLLALCVLSLAVVGLWLRIETVEGGWRRPWEEHPARLMLAVGLLTPAPAVLGFANRRWWVYQVLDRVDFRMTPEQAAVLLLLGYAVAALLLLRWSITAYQRLRSQPERDRLAGPSTPSEGELTEAEASGYWAGFSNPVWTRELRTRLRGREAPQFIFFASVALAVGGFTPLIMAAGQLGDPLATAAVAREVFFWLAMTLTALIALVAPGLTAEALGAERNRGTLELLLVTPMRRSEILRGKLLGDLSVLGLLISPSLPLFGFCYLFHGASGGQVVGVFGTLGITALLCSMLGVTASAIHTRTMSAKWQAYLLSLIFCGMIGGPFWLMLTLASPGGVTDAGGLMLLTPLFMAVYGFILAGLWSRACERLDYLDEGAAG